MCEVRSHQAIRSQDQVDFYPNDCFPFPFIFFFFQTFKILQLIFCFPEISLESPGNYISILPRQRLCELTDQWVLGFSQPTGGPETGETPCQFPFLVIATIPHHRTGDNPGCLVNHSYSLLHFKSPKEFFPRKEVSLFKCQYRIFFAKFVKLLKDEFQTFLLSAAMMCLMS